MATVVICSIMDDAAVVQFDLDSTGVTVTGVEFINNWTQNVTVNVFRPNGQVVSHTLTPGTNATLSIPKGKQFPYNDPNLADWSVSLTVG